MKNFGFIPSVITDKTPKFTAPKTMPIPLKFSYRNFLSPISNQGVDPYCVPHSISSWLNWKENIKTGSKIDNNIRYSDIYHSKKTMGEGMTYQDAFNYLKTKGVKTDKGIMKITEAGIIPDESLLKAAILANGPCFGALPVYDTGISDFWRKTNSGILGWHSIAIVGWDEKGYVIRNSWGPCFGDKGYTHISYSDVKLFREIWTILG